MNIVKLNNWNKDKFISELSCLDENNFSFYFDDILANNIEEFFKNNLNLKVIELHKLEELDIILVRKSKKFFSKFNRQFLEKNIKFIGFSQGEICSIISEELYFLYCNKYNLRFLSTDELDKLESEKLEKYSTNLVKYDEFVKICNFFKKSDRYLYFNFPVEAGFDRFVFYFLVNTFEDKNEIIELFNSIGFNKKCLDIFENVGVCENGSLYAVGFNYKDSKLVRTTLYSRLNVFSTKESKCEFLENHFNLDCDYSNLSVKDWGVDIFFDNSEILKIYFDEVNFSCDSYGNEFLKVLENKPTVSCFKYKNNKLVDKKYEFSNNLFSEDEVKILEKFNIYDKNSKLFSIYLDENNNLKNSVNYNI
jgi:hypothetical protein